MTQAFISAASSINPDQTMREAVRLLASRFSVLSLSTVYLTGATGAGVRNFSYTCVAEVDTLLQPQALQHEILAVATGAGRPRNAIPLPSVELDLILYNGLATEGEVILPHPAILQRPVLIIALNELAPDLVLPGTSVAIANVARNLELSSIRPLLSYSALLQQELRAGFKPADRKKSRKRAAG